MVDSPCIKKCKLENDSCVSCKRTLEEIKTWRSLSDKEKRKVLCRISNIVWPDPELPPINLLVLTSAKWNK